LWLAPRHRPFYPSQATTTANNTMSYESVPDVEQGDEIPTSEILIQKAQKRYPEAGSAVEAEFLGRLDDAIDNCKPEIKIPRLSPAHFGNSKDGEESSQGSGYMELIKSLKFPTVALSVTIVSAFVVIVISSPLARAMFPYYACALSFLSSIPSIKKRFLDKIGAVFDKMASVKTGAEQKVQGISDKGMHYLDMTEKAMNRALAPIKGKLAVATKFESMLKKVDPTIDIPGKWILGFLVSIQHALWKMADCRTMHSSLSLLFKYVQILRILNGRSMAMKVNSRVPLMVCRAW
jgi:hypothetical protein